MFGSVFKRNTRIEDSVDEFTGTRRHRLLDNTLAVDDAVLLGVQRLEFSPTKIERADGSPPIYTVIVIYEGRDWVFIEDTIHLLLDGRPLDLSGTASSEDQEVLPDGVLELASFNVTPWELHEIASANRVRLRVPGSGMYLECTFAAANQRRFRDFVVRLVEPEPTTGSARSLLEGGLSSPAEVDDDLAARGYKECPMCAEFVRERARICRFCRFEFAVT